MNRTYSQTELDDMIASVQAQYDAHIASLREEYETALSGAIAVVQAAPTDVIVVHIPYRMSEKASERLTENLRSVFPDNRIVFFEDGFRFQIYSEGKNQIGVWFGPSFDFDLERALAGSDATSEYKENVRFKWNHVALSANARNRLRELAEAIGGKLIDAGIPFDKVSPLQWQVVTVDPDDISDFLVELRCAAFGRLQLTVELMLDDDANVVEFAAQMLARSARKTNTPKN